MDDILHIDSFLGIDMGEARFHLRIGEAGIFGEDACDFGRGRAFFLLLVGTGVILLVAAVPLAATSPP